MLTTIRVAARLFASACLVLSLAVPACATRAGTGEPQNPLDQFLPVDALKLVATSPLRFRLDGAQFDPDTADYILTVNGVRVPSDQLRAEGHALTANVFLGRGGNVISLKAYDTIGRPLYFNETVQGREAPAARPNIVLIVADDLGYGDLASYGAPDVRTPHLDRLAREGVRFTDFYANGPVCTATRAALISGRYQQRVLLERPLSTSQKEHQDLGLPATGRSLPNLLVNAGYATALIGKWHLGFRAAFHPNRHGFQYFWGYLAGYVDWYTHVNGNGDADLYENEKPVRHDGYLGHEVTRRASKFIEEHTKAPFFLEVAYGEPHWPFQSPDHPSVATRTNNSMFQQPADAPPATRRDYVQILETADAGIGQILGTLDRLGLSSNTLVIFVSDNGGEWLSRNDPFFHRKDSLWEGGIRIPALFRWPATLPAGAVSPQVGITMDLTRTILAAAGADVPADVKLEGLDLTPLLRGSMKTVDRTLFWRNPVPGRQQKAIRSGDWKLILDGPGMQMLFNVRDDPGERLDLAARHPERVRAMKAQLDAWETDVDGEAAGLKPAAAGLR